MPLWKKADQANSTPRSVSTLNKIRVKGAVGNTNRNAAFGNTSPNIWGAFVINTNEASANPQFAHAGIIARRVGTGGRAGRVQTETLVAASGFGTAENANNSAIIHNASLKFASGLLVDKTVANGSSTTFTVNPTVRPTGAAVAFQWQISVGNGAFTNLAANAVYTNVNTNTLSISNVTGFGTNKYRVTATPGTTGLPVTSRAALLTVV